MDDLTELANAKMPFGKYKDWHLIDLPEHYLIWFSRTGYPTGKLGTQLAAVYEIKLNGLEKLVTPLKREKTPWNSR